MQKSPLEKGRRGLLLFVGENLDVGSPGMVIDGHMGDFPASLLVPPAQAPGDPMADALNTAKLLGVQMEEIPRSLMLIPMWGVPFK
jgi:hypothetical protein